MHIRGFIVIHICIQRYGLVSLCILVAKQMHRATHLPVSITDGKLLWEHVGGNAERHARHACGATLTRHSFHLPKSLVMVIINKPLYYIPTLMWRASYYQPKTRKIRG
jgi:hypothetical protein